MAELTEEPKIDLPPEVEAVVVENLAQGIAAAIWKEGTRAPARTSAGRPTLQRVGAGSTNIPTDRQGDEG